MDGEFVKIAMGTLMAILKIAMVCLTLPGSEKVVETDDFRQRTKEGVAPGVAGCAPDLGGAVQRYPHPAETL
eukprot:gene1149-942_t